MFCHDNNRAFFIVSIVIAVILLVKEYAELVVQAVGAFPKSICFVYLVGAYTFVYVVRVKRRRAY